MSKSSSVRDFLKQLRSASRENFTRGESGRARAPLSIEEKYTLSLSAADSQMKLAERVWHAAVLTIPLDLILVSLNLPDLVPLPVSQFALPLLFLLCVITVIFSFREAVIDKIQIAYQLITHHPVLKVIAIVAVIAVTVLALVIDIVTTSEHGFFSAIIQVLVYGAAVVSMLGGRRSTDSRDAYVTLLKRDYFISNTLPLLAARFILPVGILALQISGYRSDYLTLVALFALTGIALIELQPRKDHFLTRCRRCAVQIPLRLLERPTCPRCELNLDMKGRAQRQ